MRTRISALRGRLRAGAGAAVPLSLRDPASASRFLGFAYVAGALVALASMAIPRPEGTDVAGLLAIYLAAFAIGVVLLVRGARVSQAETFAALLAGTAAISLAIRFTEEMAGVYALFYVWVAIESAFFLPRRAAALQVVAIAIAFGAVLAHERPPGAEAQWLLTVGTVLIVGLIVDGLTTNVERLIARLAAAAQTDPLTDLLNRRGFQDSLGKELARARRDGRPVSVLVADLDHFKRVNDRLGHREGDRALVRFAGQLQRLTRVVDSCARLGGEEFAVVLPDAAKHDGFLVAERLRRAVKAAFADDPEPLTVSIGVACHPQDGVSGDDLLHAGDQALYAAKELGRDRSVLFNRETIGDLAEGEPAVRHGPGELSAMLVLAETLDLRDGGTAEHSQAVGRYARAIAAELGLPERDVERVALAGVLHDVGTIGLSDSVLRKAGPLTESEWEQVRRHPELGARVLAGADLEDLAGWVFAHHERVDGCGYPLGLAGAEIPLEARILAVADAYEAMTSARPYRAAMSNEDAAAELRRCAGTQFDDEVVEALLASSALRARAPAPLAGSPSD